MPTTALCPACGFSKPAPDGLAGKRVNCPKCRAAFVVAAAAPPAPPDEPVVAELDDAEPIVGELVAEAEPAVGHPLTKKPTRVAASFRCPFCGSVEPPITRYRTSGMGWAMFAMMLLLCFPIAWLPVMLIVEPYHRCSECRIKLE